MMKDLRKMIYMLVISIVTCNIVDASLPGPAGKETAAKVPCDSHCIEMNKLRNASIEELDNAAKLIEGRGSLPFSSPFFGILGGFITQALVQKRRIHEIMSQIKENHKMGMSYLETIRDGIETDLNNRKVNINTGDFYLVSEKELTDLLNAVKERMKVEQAPIQPRKIPFVVRPTISEAEFKKLSASTLEGYLNARINWQKSHPGKPLPGGLRNFTDEQIRQEIAAKKKKA